MRLEKIYHAPWVLAVCLILVGVWSCSTSDKESERSRIIRLLTNNEQKTWVLASAKVDGTAIVKSKCDSAYQLTMKADMTWQEAYQTAFCSPGSDGQWSLNDANNVITIRFANFSLGIIDEKKFEILQLDNSSFEYQYPVNNSLRKVTLSASE